MFYNVIVYLVDVNSKHILYSNFLNLWTLLLETEKKSKCLWAAVKHHHVVGGDAYTNVVSSQNITIANLKQMNQTLKIFTSWMFVVNFQCMVLHFYLKFQNWLFQFKWNNLGMIHKQIHLPNLTNPPLKILVLAGFTMHCLFKAVKWYLLNVH